MLEEQKDGARAAAAAEKKKGILGPLTELDSKGISSFCSRISCKMAKSKGAYSLNMPEEFGVHHCGAGFNYAYKTINSISS